jgi:hypothetical protein
LCVPWNRILWALGCAAALAVQPARAGEAAAAPGGAIRVQIEGRAATLRSSSPRPAATGRSSPSNLLDGKLETAWRVAAPGDGSGAWVEVEFDSPVEVEGYLIAPGDGTSDEAFASQLAPHVVGLLVDGAEVVENTLRYTMDLTPQGCQAAGGEADSGPRVIVLPETVRGRRFRLEVRKGFRTHRSVRADLAISEWHLLLPTRGAGPLPQRWRKEVDFARALGLALRSETAATALWNDQAVIRDLTAPIPGPQAQRYHDLVMAHLAPRGVSAEKGRLENGWAMLRGLLGSALTLRPWGLRSEIVGEAILGVGPPEAPFDGTPVVRWTTAEGSPRIVAVDLWVQPVLCQGLSLPEESRRQ